MIYQPRVLHMVPAMFGPDDGIVGGAERYALELARNMASRVPTRLISFGERARSGKIDELEYRVIGNPWYVRGQRYNPIALAMLSELRRADVVHCHQQHVLASSIAALRGRVLGKKVFVTDEGGGGGFDFSAYVSTDRWFNGHLHLSEYARRCWAHEGKPWAHVIFGGVDTIKFSPDDSIRRGTRVLFVGRILPHKGIADLIDAIAPGMQLDIIGQAYDADHLAMLRRRAEGKDVAFRHNVDDAALVDAYRRALCVVLPSVYRTEDGRETKVPELLGQTLLEGMATEAPVICTAVASLPEIVEDGVSGFVVPPNDPTDLGERLAWLTEHPESARAIGLAARRRVLEQFTWPRVVDRCLQIYAGGRE
jgi:glycosyltransferase involved in cell wall biosynthesis